MNELWGAIEMRNVKLIENKRIKLSQVLKEFAPQYKHISIAAGYWDLAGTAEIIDSLMEYESIRLLIGQEPIADRRQVVNNLYQFPDDDFAFDLVRDGTVNNVEELRSTAKKVIQLIENGILQVKVYRNPRLHAKAYVFGQIGDDDSIGIVGSSNFTHAGLSVNAELNVIEDQSVIVELEPKNLTSPIGHLYWYNEMWNDPEAVVWTGDFSSLLQDSPVGNLTYGPYDVYIKTLMEIFPDELEKPKNLPLDPEDILYPFQKRNAELLINKLNKMGIAMLSDSVGLGKTITAGAVIKHYIDEEQYRRIVIITPAGLKSQWVDDLYERFGLVEATSGLRNSDYKIISMQDPDEIDRVSEWDKLANVDLFVIDEAHNLRNSGSSRYMQLLDWFMNNLKSKVLMLTATPINNSLMDFARQMQLASKGSLKSITVDYKDAQGKVRPLDFFEMLAEVQSRIKRAENQGTKFNWDKNLLESIWSGLRHYLVRTTRQGAEELGGVYSKIDGIKREFPKSEVRQIVYSFDQQVSQKVTEQINSHIIDVFEGIDPIHLDVNILTDITQRTSHPLDFIKEFTSDFESSLPFLKDSTYTPNESLISNQFENNVVANIFSVVLMLGFMPYRVDSYQKQYFGKNPFEISSMTKGDFKTKILMQLASHNILHVTWLKRLESSAYALRKSVEYYRDRLAQFNFWLVKKGFLLSFTDINQLQNYEDIEEAFEDYEKYQEELSNAINSGDETKIKKFGIEKRVADPKKYDITQLTKDIERETKILNLLVDLLNIVDEPSSNSKLLKLAEFINEESNTNNGHGRKILVFSFFADTIEYLSDNLHQVVNIPGFKEKSAFLSGRNRETDLTVKRFSPKSKKYADKDGRPKNGESEIDYLFSTDILSEGQNLQDAGILVNFDLHWNPVRMIQRNGRINRLGSEYREVLIANAKPEDNLETFLKLVRRLERKVDTISRTIGTDQDILQTGDANPIEHIEEDSHKVHEQELLNVYSNDSKTASRALLDLEKHQDIFYGVSSDEFLYELRKFLEMNKDLPAEVDRIKRIPLGKWNYLPRVSIQKGLIASNEVIGLVRIEGKESITGNKLTEIAFSKIKTLGDYSGEYIDEKSALRVIRTIPQDNNRSLDLINVDRLQVRDLTHVFSSDKHKNKGIGLNLGSKKIDVINKMSKELIEDNFDYVPGYLEDNIDNLTEKQEVLKIINEAMKHNRTSGEIPENITNKFLVFVRRIREKKQMITLDEYQIKDVLYYANH